MDKKVNSLNKIYAQNKLTFLTNSLGEETGNEEIPEAAMEWYSKSCIDNEWLQYLVNIEDHYGILALQEIEHPGCEDWEDCKDYRSEEWQNASADEIMNHLQGCTDKINNIINCNVLLGNTTGIFERHEVCIFIPQNTIKQDCEKMFASIKDICFCF